MLLRLFLCLVALVLALAVLLVVAGQLGFLKGQAPQDLGVRDGRLKPPSKTENSVSSQANLYPDHPMLNYARIDPLPAAGEAAASIAKLKSVITTFKGAEIITAQPDYLYAQFTTPTLKFVDDVEFWYDPASRTVQVRSASRIGRKDMGVNRARVEVIRGLLAAQ